MGIVGKKVLPFHPIQNLLPWLVSCCLPTHLWHCPKLSLALIKFPFSPWNDGESLIFVLIFPPVPCSLRSHGWGWEMQGWEKIQILVLGGGGESRISQLCISVLPGDGLKQRAINGAAPRRALSAAGAVAVLWHLALCPSWAASPSVLLSECTSLSLLLPLLAFFCVPEQGIQKAFCSCAVIARPGEEQGGISRSPQVLWSLCPHRSLSISLLSCSLSVSVLTL